MGGRTLLTPRRIRGVALMPHVFVRGEMVNRIYPTGQREQGDGLHDK